MNKNSIFFRILVPVTMIMLLQTLLITLVLFLNGTMQTLENSAVKSLVKNAENRQITLENLMVHSWSNIDGLELDMQNLTDAYLKENNLTLDEVMGDTLHENNLLYSYSDILLETLRLSQSTGIFIYFCDDVVGESEMKFNGLYYRNLDPITITTDNSDLLFMRGPIKTARKHKIQLDSFWEETFLLSPEFKKTWECYEKTITAANAMPDLSSQDLSFWSSPLFINESTGMDANECIIYSRPLFYNGQLIGIIGTEIQVNWLKKYFPSTDFDRNGMGGYMLVTYNEEDFSDSLSCEVQTLTGSYLKRLIQQSDNLIFNKGYNSELYSIMGNNGETAQVSLHPIKLYNEGTPFGNIKWALASIETDRLLFSSSQSVKIGIISSSAIALIIGVVLIAFVITLITRPLLNLAHNIKMSESDALIETEKTKIYEVALLNDTINDMQLKRQQMDYRLREERERYLVALESVTDTFIEYDVTRDRLVIYFFTSENQKSVLSKDIIIDFLEEVRSGCVCSESTSTRFVRFLRGECAGPVEVKIKSGVFSHTDDSKADDGYHWFLFKASHMYDEYGEVEKIIGTAKQITEEKLAEKVKAEAARRDLTTGLYNKEYGIEVIKKTAFSSPCEKPAYIICIISIGGFNTIEAYYGRVFGGIIINSVGRELRKLKACGELIIRAENDNFIFYLPNFDESALREKAAQINNVVKSLYIGENPDLQLEVHTGAALSDNGEELETLFERAYSAMSYAAKSEDNNVIIWDDSADYGNEQRQIKPISINLEITKETIHSFASDAFERSADIHSVIKALLGTLGELFDMRQVAVYLYDNDFEVYQVAFQWNKLCSEILDENIEKIPRTEVKKLRQLLDKNGAIVFDEKWAADKSYEIKKLLCHQNEKAVSIAFALYENGVFSGMIIYKSEQADRVWTDAEKYSLCEVTRVISARISIQKSHTASKAKSEFLSRMSHEIRTPMNAIIGMTNIAKENSGNRDFVSDCLNKIEFSSKHLLSLINSVLEMSKIESGKLKIEEKPFSLSELSETVDMLMRPQIENKQITFTINKKYENNDVIGDEYRLRQVLVNLIGNSLKFTDSGGEINFTVEELNNRSGETRLFKFSVRDNGIGISKEDQSRIFKSFEQVGKSNNKAGAVGTGLGLSISNNIINLMNSKIEVISNFGHGSTFFFTLELKLAVDLQPENQGNEELNYEGKFKGKRVLLVEDNEINTEIALYILESSGLEVETAANGKEAVEKFNNSSECYFDLIFMDIQMPVMDGLTATREIRKNENRNDASTVPIIAMTANAFDEDMKKSIDSGMNGHVAKPIDNLQLFKLLQDLIGQ